MHFSSPCHYIFCIIFYSSHTLLTLHLSVCSCCEIGIKCSSGFQVGSVWAVPYPRPPKSAVGAVTAQGSHSDLRLGLAQPCAVLGRSCTPEFCSCISFLFLVFWVLIWRQSRLAVQESGMLAFIRKMNFSLNTSSTATYRDTGKSDLKHLKLGLF